MLGVGFVYVFDSKLVYYKGEQYGFVVVFPESWRVFGGSVAVGGESFLE
jgi:hypothetical protein